MAKISLIQEALKKTGIPAWLFYGFHDQDPIALRILELSLKKNRTRRWYYFVPRQGDPIKLVHRIEPEALDELQGEKILYSGKTELQDTLKQITSSVEKVAMQYSPYNLVPYISTVDAGVVELVKSFGVGIVSSGDLIQALEATWNERQLQSHRDAAVFLHQCVQETFAWIATSLKKKTTLTELSVQEYLVKKFKHDRYTSNHPPIVAVNEHSGNPHYSPDKKTNLPVTEDCFILLDLWCKKNEKESVYADITWVGFTGTTVPTKIQEIFETVKEARDKAIDFVRGRVLAGHPLFGYEVDDKARHVIQSRGFGEHFTHRTGHSIGQEVHWVGANIDNYETEEARRIIPKTCFSIEPGIYFPEFGVRSEVDVYVDQGHVEVNPTELQSDIILLN